MSLLAVKHGAKVGEKLLAGSTNKIPNGRVWAIVGKEHQNLSEVTGDSDQFADYQKRSSALCRRAVADSNRKRTHSPNHQPATGQWADRGCAGCAGRLGDPAFCRTAYSSRYHPNRRATGVEPVGHAVRRH